MSLAVTLEAMVSAGCTQEQMLAVARAHEAKAEARAIEKRALAAKRQAAYRDRHPKSNESNASPTLLNVTGVTEPSSLLPSSTPPTNNSSPKPSLRSDLDRARETFERFFAIFPKRINRKDAFVRWKTALKAGVDPERIIAAAIRYAEHMKFTDSQFIKAPDAWLNAGKYDDELPAEPPRPQPRGSPRPAGDGMAVVTRKLQEKLNGQQSPNQPRDITPGPSESGTGAPPAYLHEPPRGSSGGGEILNFRPASPDLRRSAAFGSEAARTFEWSGADWELG